ncbi:MAG: polyamine aminopropyltransferase [Syntrophomonadaceae bacterium]|nr:polyamine aminopropyltransferase [Syntrophomonadaceae bacterium]
MELWLVEQHTPGYRVNWKLKRTIYTEKTPYQELAIVETVDFGRALVLDGIVQVTLDDEFIYHEMITHVPLFTHPNPKDVLVIGGGDGATVREILKHPQTNVDLVEIDERVINASRQYLPEIGKALDDPRVRIVVDDGIKYVKQTDKKYDVILIDSSDPIGPATGLFSREFYQDVYRVLNDDGLMVAQTESPLFNKELLAGVYQNLSEIFPLSRVYLTCIPTYIAGFWTFSLASKKYDPLQLNPSSKDLSDMAFRYYTPAVHQAAFVLPRFVQEVLDGGKSAR